MSEDLSRRGKTIIGVDDQPENLLILQGLLTRQGYSFFGANSGAECLSLARRADPKIILLDVQMPELDGYETCRRLRKNLGLGHVPIVFLTARKSPEDVRTGLNAGGNDFIVKPFDPEKLLARVAYWMSKRIAA